MKKTTFPLRWSVALVLAGATTLAAAQGVLRVSASNDGAAPELQAERYAPLNEYLAKRLKMKVQWVPFRTDALLMNGLGAGKVDMAWISAGLLVQSPSVVPLVQRDEDARTRALIVVRADSPLRKPQDLKGRTLSFGPATSPTGYLMPRAALAAARIDPAHDLKAAPHATSEEAALQPLQSGQADAGAIGQATWERLIAEKKIDERQFRVLLTTAPFADRHLSVRSDFPENTRNWIASAFLALEAVSGGRDILKGLQTRRFVLAPPEAYDPVQAAARQAGIIR